MKNCSVSSLKIDLIGMVETIWVNPTLMWTPHVLASCEMQVNSIISRITACAVLGGKDNLGKKNRPRRFLAKCGFLVTNGFSLRTLGICCVIIRIPIFLTT